MIIGIGTDIVEVRRIKDAVEKWRGAFLDKVFTRKEISYSGSKTLMYQHLAARFAAKEATIKAFGGVGQLVAWKEIEIKSDPGGRPFVCLNGEMRKLKVRMGVNDVLVSLSHTPTYTIAYILLLSN